jgi:integrase
VFEVRHPRNGEGRRLFEVVGPRLDEAKARAREVYGDAAPRVSSVGLTFNDVLADWRAARQVRPGTAKNYDTWLRLYIEPRFGRVKVREISKGMVLRWLNGLQGKRGPLAPGTRKLILATLDTVLQHAVDPLGALGSNPVRQLGKKRKPRQSAPRRRILSPEEEARLVAYCAPFAWLAPIITVTLHQALRLGETLGLQWEDVDFTQNKLHVRRSLDRERNLGPCKAQSQEDFERGRGKLIELTPLAREALLELRGSTSSGFVFRNGECKPRHMHDVQRAFGKARERAALPVSDEGKVVFHSLRHTGISRLANHPSIPLVHVRDFARHADLATTQGYVHKIDDEKVTTAIGEALAGERMAP